MVSGKPLAAHKITDEPRFGVIWLDRTGLSIRTLLKIDWAFFVFDGFIEA
jgi:hypothetical protein